MADQSHAQVFVKINARVDEGIAPLVSALSRFPTLYTLASCQGGAFVEFRFGNDLGEQAAFFCWFSLKVTGLARLTAEWGGRDSLVFTLRCRPGDINALTLEIEKSCSILESALCDTGCKESDNYPASPCHRSETRQHDAPDSHWRDLMLRALRT